MRDSINSVKQMKKQLSKMFPKFSEWACLRWLLVTLHKGFPGDSDGKESAYNAGDLGSVPGLGRSPGEGNGNPLQYSCLENPMGRGAWQATGHCVANSRTRLRDLHFQHSVSCDLSWTDCSGSWRVPSLSVCIKSQGDRLWPRWWRAYFLIPLMVGKK